MNIKDIIFIIPNFNTFSYLRGMINQIHFYYPDNQIHIVDNGSDYTRLLQFYDSVDGASDARMNVWRYRVNDFVANLNHLLTKVVHESEYYVITDCDLQIHPATPPNFLEIFKTAIDVYGFHHAGFGLITDDIPSWNPKAGWIQGDEKALLTHISGIAHEGVTYAGYHAPIDTTFALYKRDNGGWKAPQEPQAWSNSVRLFGLHHLPWYLHKDHLNEEMKNYYATCKKRVLGAVTAGSNHYNPFNGMD